MIFVCCSYCMSEWNLIYMASRIIYGSFARNMIECWMIFVCIIRRNCILGIRSNISRKKLLYMFNHNNTCLLINWFVRILSYKNGIFWLLFIRLHHFIFFGKDDYTNMPYFAILPSFYNTYNSIFHKFYISYNIFFPSNTNCTFSSPLHPISLIYVVISKSYIMISLAYFLMNDHHQFHNNCSDSIYNVQVQGIMDNL